MEAILPLRLSILREMKESETFSFNSNPDFSIEHMQYDHYRHYRAGWEKRKIYALPKMVHTAIVKTIVHIAKIVLITLISPIGLLIRIKSRDEVIKLIKDVMIFYKKHVFHIARDFQESFGHFMTLFHDRLGTHIVTVAQLHHDLYDMPLYGFYQDWIFKEQEQFLQEYPIGIEKTRAAIAQMDFNAVTSLKEIFHPVHFTMVTNEVLNSLPFEDLSEDVLKTIMLQRMQDLSYTSFNKIYEQVPFLEELIKLSKKFNPGLGIEEQQKIQEKLNLVVALTRNKEIFDRCEYDSLRAAFILSAKVGHVDCLNQLTQANFTRRAMEEFQVVMALIESIKNNHPECTRALLHNAVTRMKIKNCPGNFNFNEILKNTPINTCPECYQLLIDFEVLRFNFPIRVNPRLI